MHCMMSSRSKNAVGIPEDRKQVVFIEESVGKEVQEEKKDEHCSRISGCGKTVSGCSGAGSGKPH